MNVYLFSTFWGMEGTLREKFERVANAGYRGLENALPAKQDESEFKELLEEFNLLYIAQVVTHSNHKETFHEQLEYAQTYSPIFVNSHTGKDYMSDEEQDSLFAFALQKEQEIGIEVGHETHRGRCMFTPRATTRLLRQFPQLKITADFSHFTCVCESLLHDQEDDMELMIKRALHAHTRVGYTQGPQVPHPAAPQYTEELARFEGWWDEIYKFRKAEGMLRTTFTPEFGPINYMPIIPFSGVAVADVFEVNAFIAKRLSQKYNTSPII